MALGLITLPSSLVLGLFDSLTRTARSCVEVVVITIFADVGILRTSSDWRSTAAAKPEPAARLREV